MKFQVYIFLFCLIPFTSFAQEFGRDRFGVNFGVSNFRMDTNFISSKSDTGFVFGVTSGVSINDSFEFLYLINYNYHRFKLIARESELSDPEELKANLQNLSFSWLLHYKVIEVKEFVFGANLGPMITLFTPYSLKDSSKNGYLIDPMYVVADRLNIEKWNDTFDGVLNVFVSVGFSCQYKNFLGDLRYNKGITDPYRALTVYSPFMEFKGKDNYWSFTITYFFN